MNIQHLDDTLDGEGVLLITGGAPLANYVATITYPSHDPAAVEQLAAHDALHPTARSRVPPDQIAAVRALIVQQHYSFSTDANGMKVLAYQILEDGEVEVEVALAALAEQHPSVRPRVVRFGPPRLRVGRTP